MSLSTAAGDPNGTVSVTLSLANSDEVSAVDVTIPLGDQLSYVEGSCVLNSERANGHSVSAGVGDEGALRIVIVDYDLNTLNGNSGELATFSLKLKRLPDTYPLVPTAVLSDATGAALEASCEAGAVTILAPRLEVVTQQIDYGHIPIRSLYSRTITLRNTGTEPVNVSAVEFSAEEFTAEESSFAIAVGATRSVTIKYAPVNYGAISEEVTFVSDAINGTQRATIVADPYSVNELRVSNAEGISDGVVTMSLTMNNMEPIVAAQWSFKLPDGLEYVEGSLAPSSRASSFNAYTTVKNDTLTMILYSSSNAAIEGEDGEIATFDLRLDGKSGYYYLKPVNTVLGNIKMHNMTSAVYQGRVRIKSPTLSSNATLAMGATPVTEPVTMSYSVRNSGQSPLTIERVAFMAEGFSTTTPLPMVIANGSSSVIEVTYTPTVAGDYSAVMNLYTNDPQNRMKSVTVSGEIYEPNNLVVTGQATVEGYRIDVALDNYSELVALQMDVHWISGMTAESTALRLTERLNGLSGSVSHIGDNTYRVVIYSASNTAMSGNSGEILSLHFVNSEDVAFVGTQLTIDNVVMSSEKSLNMSSQQSLTHTAMNTPGDANGDGAMSVVDVVATVNAVLSGTSDGVVKVNIDTSGDGELTITDVVGVANVALSSNE